MKFQIVIIQCIRGQDISDKIKKTNIFMLKIQLFSISVTITSKYVTF